MKYATQYVRSAANILGLYKGEEPFHHFIKRYFSANKKFGSGDRRHIAALCYNYFRPGHALKNTPVEKRIVLSAFICAGIRPAFPEYLPDTWELVLEKPMEQRLALVPSLQWPSVFPYYDQLSEGIDHLLFSLSFLIQPGLYLRLRPGCKKQVEEKLSKAEVPFIRIGEDGLALPNGAKVDSLLQLDREAVVQDINSQRTAGLLAPITGKIITVWDACAASGGKSILVYDRMRDIELTVSDKRSSILQNLHERFAKAGIKKYYSQVADLAKSSDAIKVPGNGFDLVICDAPCTGSGTWSRTPEQLFYFDEAAIEKYADLQKKIVANLLPKIKPGGYLLYITCSVFRKENEDMAGFLQQKNCRLVQMQLLKGYENKADTLFAALFTVPAV